MHKVSKPEFPYGYRERIGVEHISGGLEGSSSFPGRYISERLNGAQRPVNVGAMCFGSGQSRKGQEPMTRVPLKSMHICKMNDDQRWDIFMSMPWHNQSHHPSQDGDNSWTKWDLVLHNKQFGLAKWNVHLQIDEEKYYSYCNVGLRFVTVKSGERIHILLKYR